MVVVIRVAYTSCMEEVAPPATATVGFQACAAMAYSYSSSSGGGGSGSGIGSSSGSSSSSSSSGVDGNRNTEYVCLLWLQL